VEGNGSYIIPEIFLEKYRKIRKPVLGWLRIEAWTSATLEAGLLTSPS
jgi:hypothetical protein